MRTLQQLLVTTLFACFSMISVQAGQEGDPDETIIFTMKQSPATAEYNSSSLSAMGKIFFLGENRFEAGENCDESQSFVVYDPSLDCWIPREGLTECDSAGEANYVSARTQLFVLSGRDDNYEPIENGRRYNPALDEWETIGSIPGECGLVRSAMVEFGGNVYVFGGIEDCREPAVGDLFSNRAWRFDPETGEWTRLADMPNRRAGDRGGNGGAFVMGGEIWLVGGDFINAGDQGDEPTIDVYDPKTDTWKESRQAPPCPWGHTVKRGTLYCFNEFFESAWKYDVGDDSWEEVEVEIGFGRLPVGGEGNEEIDVLDVNVVNGKFYARATLSPQAQGRNQTWMFEGKIGGAPEATLHVSPNEGIIGSTQKLNALFAVEMIDEDDKEGREPIEWTRFLINGKDRTRGMMYRGIPGKLDRGDSIRFAAVPKVLATRLGPGAHTIEVEVETPAGTLNKTVTWRCIETYERKSD